TPLSPPDLRHLFYFITYLAGVWAFYALGTRWLTRNAALGATLLFMTQPILWGHAFMNPKDTPFLAFFLLSLFFGFKMTDSIKPISFDSLTPLAKKTLPLLTTLWLVSVFPLFIFTDAFHAALTGLVHAAQSGQINIISLIATDIRTAAPEIYIQKYFTLFLHARAIYFLLSTSILLYFHYRLHPSSFILYPSILLPAILLGFTTSLRILGPFAGLIVVYYATRNPALSEVEGTQQKARNATIFVITSYTVIAIIAMYLTWPYLWTDPVGHLFGSLKAMSAYPWKGQVLFNGIEYASTALPYSYLPVLLGIQLTEPVWALSIAGVVVSIVGRRPERVEGWREKRELIELTILWFIIPLIGFIILRSALYDNFRQVIFILPPVFWMAGVVFEKIKNTKWQIALVTLCLIPGIAGIIRLHPYEYIYYNSFIGGVDGAQERFELDYWGISYREAAEHVNKIAPANAVIWVEGPSHLFELYAREDLKIYSDHEAERAERYDYVVATTRYNLDQASYPDAKIIYEIARGDAILTVIKQP
ncbi:MAG: hypothetical protein Q7T89_12545, partial [Anaerolineales bacterium]|nr:hypothetical protein [Anaerolineales bacterium]